MKVKTKSFLFLFSLLSILILSSCIGTTGSTGPQGPQGPAGEGDNWEVDEYTIRESDWIRDGQVEEAGSFYYFTLLDPDLSTYIFDEGLVQIYKFTGQTASGSWKQAPLPEVRMYEENGFQWTENVDYEYGVGELTIFVTYSDFNTSVLPPEMSFRVVKEW